MTMRRLFWAIALLSLTEASAGEVRDTVLTSRNDKIILTYDVTSGNGRLTLDFSRPRIIPSARLYEDCKGELDKLKVVVFDRIGDFGKTRWSGLSPEAFIVPGGLSYDKTSDGYYILGECREMEFGMQGSADKVEIKLPLYIAVYEKKQNYRIVSSGGAPLRVSCGGGVRAAQKVRDVERIAVTSSVELEAENADLTSALSSMEMVRELLSRETEVPFSQTLQMEIYNLRSLKNQIKEQEMVQRINDVLLLCSDRERELKDAMTQSALAAQAQEQALLQQQRQEAEAQQKEAEEKARIQEEKQQKKTLWMIVGGVVLAIAGFIGNAVFKHFRDVRNQKSIMQMQESLARQAEHEAGRRSREIIRNKVHRAANEGKNKIRKSVGNTGKPTNNTNRRSI